MAAGSTATRKRSSNNGNGASASGSAKSAAKKPAQKTAQKAKEQTEETSGGGSVTEKLKLVAIAGGSAAVGAAGGYAGASMNGGSGSRSTVKVPKFKTSTSVKLIAAAAKIGYSIGRTREKLAS